MNKTFALAVLAACLVAPLPAMAQQSAKKPHVNAAHNYWLADGLNQLALLLPNRKAGASARQ